MTASGLRRCVRDGTLALTVALVGCGAASSPGVRTLDTALATRDAVRARGTAPELFVQAREADGRAHEALARGDRAAADDEATVGRLFLQAALAETRRADAEHAAATARDAARAARALAATDEAERAALEARATRLAAAGAAEDELARALARARIDEPHRGRLPSNDADSARAAARAISQRARLLVAAATALGATDEETAPVTSALAAASASLQADPRTALASADRGRLLAESALGAARARIGGAPDQASVAELGEAAHAAGLAGVATPRGVEIRTPLFRGQTPDARLVAELAALITAHPSGPVRIELEARADPASRRVAAQRVARVVAALVAAGASPERIQGATEPATPPVVGGASVVVVFLGYASPAVATVPPPPAGPAGEAEEAGTASTPTASD